MEQPWIGIRTAWLSRFPTDASDELEPFVTLVDGIPTDKVTPRFSASMLLPPEASAGEQCQTLLVFPMICETQNLGVAAFDYNAGINGYQLVANQISAALRTVSLHHEVVLKTKLHERIVQERAATAKRMQSLSVLAGGVAHDLNNAFGPLVGLPAVMLSELDQLGVASGRTSELRADLENIRSATLRVTDDQGSIDT